MIRKASDIGAMQFGSVPGKGTTDVTFKVRHLQKKFPGKKK